MLHSVVVAALLLAANVNGLGANTTLVLNKRYCEILYVSTENGSFTADVFNTFGLNDCPEPLWNAITPENAKSDPNTIAVVLNGPRYWRMDEFGPLTSPVVKERVVKYVGGIGMSLAGRVTIPKMPITPTSYTMSMVKRNAQWIWRAGSMVLLLTNTTSGDTFIMQSNKANSTEDINDLESLGTRFKDLPPSWTFTATRLSQDLNITTPALVGGTAEFGIVVQDEFQNTYSYTQDVDALAIRMGLVPKPTSSLSKASGISVASASVVLFCIALLLFLE
ncbi:hypothetical protein DYB32_004060 [Aphanomyces invadans]|uniref:Uncharacterized protein n=1 Tax=Aphanomyces invadans TaxID=157072 RepID=A0A3R6WMX4_9STRA|nr:hypothetical protein DYB32_004060 [Aphanomyces invadans]